MAAGLSPAIRSPTIARPTVGRTGTWRPASTILRQGLADERELKNGLASRRHRTRKRPPCLPSACRVANEWPEWQTKLCTKRIDGTLRAGGPVGCRRTPRDAPAWLENVRVRKQVGLPPRHGEHQGRRSAAVDCFCRRTISLSRTWSPSCRGGSIASLEDLQFTRGCRPGSRSRVLCEHHVFR